MKRSSDLLRFLAVAILAYALAGVAAAVGLHLLLGRQQGAWPTWAAGAAGLFVALAAALPSVILLRRWGSRNAGTGEQKVGDRSGSGAIL